MNDQIEADDFSNTLTVLVRFLKGCAEMHPFDRQFPLVYWLTLSVLNKSTRPIPLRVICRHIGLDMATMKRFSAALEKNNLIIATEDGLSVSEPGKKKLKTVNSLIAARLNVTVIRPEPIRSLARDLKRVGRVWSKRHDPERLQRPQR